MTAGYIGQVKTLICDENDAAMPPEPPGLAKVHLLLLVRLERDAAANLAGVDLAELVQEEEQEARLREDVEDTERTERDVVRERVLRLRAREEEDGGVGEERAREEARAEQVPSAERGAGERGGARAVGEEYVHDLGECAASEETEVWCVRGRRGRAVARAVRRGRARPRP